MPRARHKVYSFTVAGNPSVAFTKQILDIVGEDVRQNINRQKKIKSTTYYKVKRLFRMSIIDCTTCAVH